MALLQVTHVTHVARLWLAKKTPTGQTSLWNNCHYFETIETFVVLRSSRNFGYIKLHIFRNASTKVIYASMKTATGNSYRAILKHVICTFKCWQNIHLGFLFGPEILPPARRPVKQVLYCTNPNRKNNQLNSFVGYWKSFSTFPL